MSILIKNVLLEGKRTDIFIEGDTIKRIGKNLFHDAETVINGKNFAAIPSFINSHTHAAMTLLRGYADDMELHEWLNNKIWPLEAKLTNRELYWGTKLACLEMIKSGTTFFNDMYFFKQDGNKDAIQAAVESGIRMMAGHVMLDFSPSNREKEWQIQRDLVNYVTNLGNSRITVAINPHSIYSVSEESLRWCKKFADEKKLMIHTHLSETKKEVEDSIKNFGRRPAEYLEEIGFLGKNVIAAHVICVNDKEIEILKRHNVKVAHNPASNMKLSSGIMPYEKMRKVGVQVCLGTDGCASNNNLDMLESMKFAALLHKLNSLPTTMPCQEAFDLATINGAKAFNLDSGIIEEGKLADLLLINLKNLYLNPRHNLISNLVYSGNSECIDTTICDGKILMQNRFVPDEEKIIDNANEIAESLKKNGT